MDKAIDKASNRQFKIRLQSEKEALHMFSFTRRFNFAPVSNLSLSIAPSEVSRSVLGLFQICGKGKYHSLSIAGGHACAFF